MKGLLKIISTVCALSVLLVCPVYANDNSVTNDLEPQNGNKSAQSSFIDEMDAKYMENIGEKVSSETVYLKYTPENENEPFQEATEEQFKIESAAINNPIIGTYGYRPGDFIPPDVSSGWVMLQLNVFKLSSPVHNNSYGFSGSYQWMTPPAITLYKDVFGMANDTNVVFDTTTFYGQSITPDGDVYTSGIEITTDYNINSQEVYPEVSGVAYKLTLNRQLGNDAPSRGYIRVYGNSVSPSASIGLTYAHAEVTGAVDVSIDSSGPSVSVKPELSFDKKTIVAAIDF